MHRIVIVGGGVAGLDLATVLGNRDGFDVALIDAATQHVWKPMLHSIAAGTEDPALVGASYVRQARRHGFTYVPGRATRIEGATREVVVDAFMLHDHPLLPERRISYDTLVIATGSIADPFDTPGVAEHTHHIDSLAEAAAFQRQVMPQLVAAAQAGRCMSIGIVGGGATGVQLAAELVRIADTYDTLGLPDARSALQVTLVDRGARLLPAFPDHVSAAARARLESLGIAVRLDVDVTAVTAEGLMIGDGEMIATDLAIWAAGVQAAPLAAALDGVAHDKSGRIVVDDHCRTTSEDIFAVGDSAALPGPAGKPLPPTAQVAYQQAVYLGRRLTAMLAGRTVPGFRYRDYGSLVALGGYDAYGALGRFGLFGKHFLRGRAAQAGHAFLYRRHQWRLHGVWRAALLWASETARRMSHGSEKLR